MRLVAAVFRNIARLGDTPRRAFPYYSGRAKLETFLGAALPPSFLPAATEISRKAVASRADRLLRVPVAGLAHADRPSSLLPCRGASKKWRDFPISTLMPCLKENAQATRRVFSEKAQVTAFRIVQFARLIPARGGNREIAPRFGWKRRFSWLVFGGIGPWTELGEPPLLKLFYLSRLAREPENCPILLRRDVVNF